ncbi:FKBP-type peptidyl-prolyl isomerase-like protein [Dyadobacter jejuensis]|uniref:Peptidyl-prolyl cis-trans isomerase n=1 Tax=Dyadobacter jejuensis TaxID=1082580 RepID=A0A316AI79_9BACT|nr:FKBP-type peptidyl-prolyl cis-trans isomerase [Dyadobacter jejuensis]PWJ56949.1 FKBP-type peptidyl-prolyl isomerase-like protein [Dyadobacter jejuensis]
MKSKYLFQFLALVLILNLTSCMKDDNQDEEKAAENILAIDTFIKADSMASSALKDSAGFYYINRLANPSGQKVKTGDAATVKVAVYLLTGEKVLSTDTDSTYTFTVGANATSFFGLDLGIYKMSEGEKTTFLLPYYYAFGSSAQTNIPAYSPVRMELELVKTRTEVQQIDDYLAKKLFTVSERKSNNLVIIRTNQVTGDTLGVGKSVNVKYIGKYLNEYTFDEGTISVTTGTSGVIPGFDQAVRRMRKGEKAIIIFPSALGYGTGSQYIPPYTPLQFELEILQ